MSDKNQTSVTPFLTVNNCKNAVEFYVSAWNASVLTTFNLPEDKMSAKISIDGAEFWVGDEEPQYGNVSPNLQTQSSIRVILTTRHADAFYDRALEFGAEQICPMTTEEDWRIGKLKDPFGHIWEIGYVL